MDINKLYEIFKKHPQVTTDTRKIVEGAIFFALKGANFNGNQYAQKALDMGCSYAVIDEKEYAVDERMLLVDDVLKALQDLANYHRNQLTTPIIAITGTNGKTTTKELVASVLGQQYNVLYTEGNLNNHIGVPLTLLRLNRKHDIAVVEMGANHISEIHELALIAEPNYGIITNIGQAHLEGFGSVENILKAKGELYEYIRKRNNGLIFIDYDNEKLRSISENITCVYYGLEEDLFVSGQILECNPYLKFQWKFVDSHYIVQTKLIGNYNLPNALAAIAVGRYFGVKAEYITNAIENYEPNNNRSQLKQTNSNMLIVDAYNANPTSMQAALDNFSHMNVKNKSLIIGEMKELGMNSEIEHQKVVDYIAQHNFSNVFLVGENFGKVDRYHYPYYESSSSLKDYLTEHPLKDQYILIKGSRGVHLEDCIDIL
ncbi:UDP-N-acetylmuramoyl-tripeptide--D-alanyl-D-alanine ligase [Dysgonomonas sp. 520]|uniref:UDP-N-acetylmuramoyl-tripeptide--D-alanyl-D- alanine ligase n=1 Tax=Dysgonomonas sp. 520 TaxID=2302931 RepID=UPI0013CF577D|nr:UDP-N-acetylmuramoyl-tripeptide--D-alanyl-D-alanine ligase [Dysgonomonas sp. 520]NDW11219.1 UDP-N-acetylmuramoyl-tripeptide--D-alanyl-D-alanine ligase [Dysgonomonas sp. 520]